MNEVLKQISAMALLEDCQSGCVLTDVTGTVLYVNEAFSGLAQRESTDLIGQPINAVLQLPPKADCTVCLGMETASTMLGDTKGFPVHSGFLAIEQGKLSRFKVKIKHSLIQNQWILSLIDPFAEDTTLIQAHSDFVSTVSHEFRTPLTSIKGFADTLLKYGTQLPEDEKRRFINIIKDQADRLIRLVENLLTASRVGTGKVDFRYRPVPLKKLLEKVAQSIQAKAALKANRHAPIQVLVNPESLEVWADSDRLEQILINLIDNAVKYSSPSSPVRVMADFLPNTENQVRIAIQDEGPGIPQEALSHIFTKFYRVETPLKQEVEGTGLGLYITQSLTNSMSGTITAQSELGKGSAFTLTFPAATPELQAAYRRKLYASEEAV